jgi:hypothetical protein
LENNAVFRKGCQKSKIKIFYFFRIKTFDCPKKQGIMSDCCNVINHYIFGSGGSQMYKTAFLCIVICLAIPCTAATITVNKDGSGDYTTIQEGIDAAVNGDIVIVAEGFYNDANNVDLNFGGKAITVRSTDPNDFDVVYNTTISCNGTESENHRGFIFNSGEGRDSILEGFTIDGGYATNGGSIYCSNSSPTIKSCLITDCTTSVDGGGIYCGSGSSPLISDCWIIGNYTPYEVFQGYGGGIYCGSGSSPVITDCRIEVNYAGKGGGIACVGGSTVAINDSVVCMNTATADFSCVSCGVYGGGGIYSRANSSGTPVTNVNNCTIVGNQATNGAVGGVYAQSGLINLSNSIVWDNAAFYGSEIGKGNTFGEDGYLNVSYCDIKGGLGGVFLGVGCCLTWGLGNIDSDPCFAYWNGVWVWAPDFHLESQAGRWDPCSQNWATDAVTSPCIDAGNPGCVLGNEPNDVANVRINMGAYGGTTEASRTPAGWGLLCDVNNDWSVNTGDLVWLARYFYSSGECIPADFSRDQIVNVFDFVHLYIEWLDVR